MDSDDFQDLYKLLRGSRCAMTVLDSRALFVEKKMEESLEKLTEARASFAESRYRVLKQNPEKQIDPKAKDRDRQLKKAKRKQEKAQETLDAFDELLPVLAKLAERDQLRGERQASKAEAIRNAEASPIVEDAGLDSFSDFDSVSDGPLQEKSTEDQHGESESTQRLACMADFSDAFLTDFAEGKGDEKLDLIGQRFGFRPVEDDQDVINDGVYLIQTSKRCMLVCLAGDACQQAELPLLNLMGKKRIKPVTRKAFVGLGTQRKMVLLTCPDSAESIDVDPIPKSSAEEVRGEEGEIEDIGTTMDDVGTVVDERALRAANKLTVNDQIVADTVVED